MEITTLLDYTNIITIGLCLCIGYALKEAFPKFPNNYIPLSMLFAGTLINIIVFQSISATVILGGMISGLASTGLHQTFKNFINNL